MYSYELFKWDEFISILVIFLPHSHNKIFKLSIRSFALSELVIVTKIYEKFPKFFIVYEFILVEIVGFKYPFYVLYILIHHFFKINLIFFFFIVYSSKVRWLVLEYKEIEFQKNLQIDSWWSLQFENLVQIVLIDIFFHLNLQMK